MKKAIVTGGTGFIGSWLIEELLCKGVEVVTLVRDRSRLLKNIAVHPHCRVVEGELSCLSPERLFSGDGYDVFYHLGWGGVSPEHKNDVEVQLDNIDMSIHAVELANAIGCRKFIASGTVAEYVFCEDIMDVNARQTPNDMYGAAKVSAHYFLEVRAKQLGMPFIWTVIPSTFGERRTDNNIITYTIRTLLKREKPLYGDLEQMWDFLYVAEVARALRYIGERGIPGKTYGIGSGVYKPLKEYIIAIRDQIDPKLELGIGEYPGMSRQTFSSCVNIYDLIKDTGFVPEIGFVEGIEKTIRYWSGLARRKKEELDGMSRNDS